MILSIPSQTGGPEGPLLELFPLQLFDVDRPGVSFLSGRQLLEPDVGKELLYWQWCLISAGRLTAMQLPAKRWRPRLSIKI